MTTQIKQIEAIFGSISENLLLLTYQKVAAQHPDIFPTAAKKEYTFYVTVYYKGEKIRSRSVSSTPVENNYRNEMRDAQHLDLLNQLEKIKNADTIAGLTKTKGKVHFFSLRIGHAALIVSNSNKHSVQLFTFILAAQFVLLKNSLLIKEWGTWSDLYSYAKKTGGYPDYYVRTVQGIAFGELGGHK